jgi:UMF1 family MFS transporter
LWYFVFALPLFLFVPDHPTKAPLSHAVSAGIRTLLNSLKKWKEHKSIFQFLLARMIYTDGLNTIFAFGGIYAAGTFGMEFSELIIFGIGINVTAGFGAILFGWLDDRWGPKKVITLSVIALFCIGLGTLVVTDKTHFLILGVSLGIFAGPAQAASRTYMAHSAPKKIRNELFGLYALSGKATAFVGPLMVAVATDLFASQRAGMASILVFFLIGLACMKNLPDIRGQKENS